MHAPQDEGGRCSGCDDQRGNHTGASPTPAWTLQYTKGEQPDCSGTDHGPHVVDRTSTFCSFGLGQHPAAQRQHNQADRDVDQKRPPPVDRFNGDRTQGRPCGRSCASGRAPDPHRQTLFRCREQRQQQSDRCRGDHGRTGTLTHPRCDQHPGSRRRCGDR